MQRILKSWEASLALCGGLALLTGCQYHLSEGIGPATSASGAKPTAQAPAPAATPQTIQEAQAQPQAAISTTADRPSKAVVRANKHMVVAANPHASAAGLEILKAGGSAVDAAIATQMVLNVVEPQSSGIGGGAFMMHFTASSGAIDAYDGRETARPPPRPICF